MTSLFRRLRRPPKEHEHSIPLRGLTLAAQAISILAVMITTRLWVVGVISIVILGFGHASAYQAAKSGPRPLRRVAAFVMLHLALGWMCVGLFTTQPFPQAQFAMIAMAIISWELFSRLNLASGFGFALANLYVAATLSRSMIFGMFLLIYVALMLAFMWEADAEDGTRRNPLILRTTASLDVRNGVLRELGTWGLRFAAILTLVASLIFFVTPHYAGQPLIKPFSFRAPIRSQPSAQIINPAVPLVQVEGWSDGESEYYYGFDSQLDLSYRGGLSNTVMMYVRSPAWSYWRSHAFDHYDGRTWTQSSQQMTRIVDREGGALFRLRATPPGSPVFVQTFFIMEPMPNLVFTGGSPVDVYIAAEEISVDVSDGVRIGSPLEPGMIYSVVSTPQDYTPESLQTAGTAYPAEVTGRYLQLPDTVTWRTRVLAQEITQGVTTPYDKAIAIREYLKATYPYDFYPPPQPPGTDAVDQFLFVDQRGVCEHYVSAMVIMLRSLGIPSRLTSGFGSGTFNRVTGYYEVRADDAHAWVEVYFPGYGWVPFDPTPGWTGNPQTGPVQRWVFSNAMDNIDLSGISAPFTQAAQAGAAFLSFALVPILIAVGVGLLIGLLLWLWPRWERWASQREARAWQRDPRRQRIFKTYRKAQKALRCTRTPTETPAEHARRNPALVELAPLVEVAAYRPAPPEDEEIDELARWEARWAGNLNPEEARGP